MEPAIKMPVNGQGHERHGQGHERHGQGHERHGQGHERHGQGHELRYLCDTIDPVGAIEAIEGKLLMLQRRPSQQGYRDSNSFLPPFLPPSLRCSLLPSLPSETVGLTEMALLHGVDDSATG